MDTLAVIAVAGAATLGLGGAVALLPGLLRPGLSLQTLGIALLGGTGVAVLAGSDPVGAAFSSEISPAIGIDALSGFFLALLALTAIPTLIYAREYFRGDLTGRVLGGLLGAFLLALGGVLVARDVTTFLAFWELMTLIPATAILVAKRDSAVRAAVFAYLAITHIGGGGVWIALLTLAHRGAFGDPAALAAAGSGVQGFVAITALIGFGTKAGLVPMHTWLPRAHPVAPAPFSALMSGMMVKVALYGLIRVEFEWLGESPRWLGLALVGCGLISALGGATWALVQPDLKRVLAYSTIENVGIITLGLGASLLFRDAGQGGWSAIAFAAALLQLANHAFFKVLLFLGAGVIERAAGTLELDRLGGLLRRMPQAGGAFLVGCMAIAGLPVLGGFAAEWLTLQSLMHLGFANPLGIALAAATAAAGLALTAGLALLCFVQIAGLVLLGRPRTPECETAVEPPAAMRAGLITLAGMCVAAGLVPGLVMPTLAGLVPGGEALARQTGFALPATGTLPTAALALALGGLVLLLVRLRGTRRSAPQPTWACGQDVTPALNWTSMGFTKPLRLVLEVLLRPQREIAVTREGGVLQSIEFSGHVPSLIDQSIYDPAIRSGLRGAELARRMQTGNVRTYAAYLLVLVVGLLLLARIGVLG